MSQLGIFQKKKIINIVNNMIFKMTYKIKY